MGGPFDNSSRALCALGNRHPGRLPVRRWAAGGAPEGRRRGNSVTEKMFHEQAGSLLHNSATETLWGRHPACPSVSYRPRGRRHEVEHPPCPTPPTLNCDDLVTSWRLCALVVVTCDASASICAICGFSVALLRWMRNQRSLSSSISPLNRGSPRNASNRESVFRRLTSSGIDQSANRSRSSKAPALSSSSCNRIAARSR